MAYRFNGSTNYVEFSVAPLVGLFTDALTIAVLLKRGATGANMAHGPAVLDSTLATAKIYERFSSGDQLQLLPGPPGGGPTLSNTALWYLIAITCPTPPTTIGYHVHNGTSWTHTTSSGATWGGAGSALISGDRLFAGKLGTGLLPFNGDIVCMGLKKANSTSLQVETLTPTAFSTWQAFGFDWLIGFDTSLQLAGALQDQASPGTGDQVGISGTTVVSDPPGWSWAAAASAFVPRIAIL